MQTQFKTHQKVYFISLNILSKFKTPNYNYLLYNFHIISISIQNDHSKLSKSLMRAS